MLNYAEFLIANNMGNSLLTFDSMTKRIRVGKTVKGSDRLVELKKKKRLYFVTVFCQFLSIFVTLIFIAYVINENHFGILCR